MTTLGDHSYALRCSLDGRIVELLHHNIEGLKRQVPGAFVTALVDSGSLQKATAFLDEIRRRGSALYWELNVRTTDGLSTLLFSGQLVDAEMLVVATQTRGGLFDLCDVVAASMPAAVDQLLSFAEQHRAQLGVRIRRDMEVLDELTRLNKEVAALGRELALRAATIARLEQERKDLLASIATGLGAPLDVVRTCAEYLLKPSSKHDAAQRKTLVETIGESVTQMRDVIDTLLDERESKTKSEKATTELAE